MRAQPSLFALLLLLTPTPASAQDTKKPLTVEDLYLIESVRGAVLFPKEEKLVYERVWIDARTKTERHSLWLVTGTRDKRKPLQKDEPDGRSPVVSPDGQWIAFLSTRPDTLSPLPKARPKTPPYSDPYVDIWLYHVKSDAVFMLGGPDRPWGRVFHDGFYGRVAFSPDSKRLVFVADDGADPRTKEEIENDVEIVRPDQGEGYTGYGAAQIWVAELDEKAEKWGAKKWERLTKDDVWYGDPQWSPDGKSLIVVANKTKDRESVRFSINKNFDLYVVDIESKKQTQLTTNPGPDVSPRFHPNGTDVVYLSVPRGGPHRDVFDVGVVSIDKSPFKPRHVPDTRENGVHPIYPLPLNPFKLRILEFFCEDGAATQNRYLDLDSGKTVAALDPPRPLMPEVNDFLKGRRMAAATTLKWKSDDFTVEGIFTEPPPEVARPPYKLIVYPHGGPHSRSTLGFDFTVQLFATQGYAVFQPNFRGSSGYGKKFLDADRLDLGGGDMRDILTGIDMLVKEGKVDPKQQFVYGISYGGFMTSWLVGQTHQFRAAVAQNAVTDMNMMWGLSDLQSWTHWELGGFPWEQPERYKKHSPLTYADKVKTPTLILHARDDRRCPLPMGKAFHQALLANGVPTQMVIYPNEGHGIRSPRHREDVYRRVLAWFAEHGK